MWAVEERLPDGSKILWVAPDLTSDQAKWTARLWQSWGIDCTPVDTWRAATELETRRGRPRSS